MVSETLSTTTHVEPGDTGLTVSRASVVSDGEQTDRCLWRTPMQGAQWIAAGQAVFCAPQRCDEISVPGGSAALVKTGLGRAMLGIAQIGEPIEPIYENAVAAERIARALVNLRRPIAFGHMPDAGHFFPAFATAARGRGVVVASPAGACPVIHLDDSWRDLPGRFSKRRRSDVRRMIRRAETEGALATELLSPSPSDVAPLLDRAIAIEARGWKSREKTALAQDPAQAAFFRDYARRMAETGQLRLAFLTIGGIDAAMQIMVEDHDALWMLKIGYDEQFAKASPGTLLMIDVVRDAAERGLDRVEFLGKASAWTAFWTTDVRSLSRLYFFPFNLAGLAALAGRGLIQAIRMLRRKVTRLWHSTRKSS